MAWVKRCIAMPSFSGKLGSYPFAPHSRSKPLTGYLDRQEWQVAEIPNPMCETRFRASIVLSRTRNRRPHADPPHGERTQPQAELIW